MAEGYNKSLDKVLFKEAIRSDKRYLNIEAYSYDGGQTKIRIKVTAKNTNAEADANKKWINQKGISAITKEEAEGLIIALEKAIIKLK